MTNKTKMNSAEAPAGYRAAPGHGKCNGCAFYTVPDDDGEDYRAMCWSSPCTPYFRDDKQHVIFIKKE